MPVTTGTVYRDGWTTSSDPKAWAVLRPLTFDDLDDSAAAQETLSRLSLFTLEGTAAFVRQMLNSEQAPQVIFPTIRRLLRQGVLLAPLTGLLRRWQYSKLVPELDKWLSDAMTALSGQHLTPHSRRALANLWLATLEGRTLSVTRERIRSFVNIYLGDRRKGKWLSGVGEHQASGLRELGVLVGAEVQSKWSPLINVAEQFLPRDVLNEWRGSFEKFKNEKYLGSVSSHENAFKHFLVFLSSNPQIHDVDNFFSSAIERPSLGEWLKERLPRPTSHTKVLNVLYDYLLWIASTDDRFCTRDELTGDPILRSGVCFPFKFSDVSNSWSGAQTGEENPSETVQMALPSEYLEEIDRILFDDDMAWPKRRSVDWIDYTPPGSQTSKRIYCPVLPYLVSLLIKIPIRQVQARRLDSGEGDAETFDLATGDWVPNYGRHKGYWKRVRVAQEERGVLRRLDDSFEGRTLCGLFINSNKTVDRRTLFDERSGYVIKWHNDAAIEIITKMREWQEEYNPVAGPLEYKNVRMGVFEKMAGSAEGRRPACFYLFRYPGGNARAYRESPPSPQQIRMFWYEVLGELEARMKEKRSNAPDLISSWLGNSPQASPYTLHGLRHAGLTRLAMSGVHPWILQNIVAGHAAWVMTLYYIKPNAAHISDTLNEAVIRAMREKQEEFRQFLTSRTIEEVHRATIAGSHGIDSVKSLRSAGLKNVAGHLAPLGFGLCPNGRMRCDEGVRIADRTEYKYKEGQKVFGPVPVTVGGAPDCSRCRFFITGTPFMEALRIRANEISVYAHSSALRYDEFRRTLDEKETAHIRSCKDGSHSDPMKEQELHVIRQELKAEADILADLVDSLNAHVQIWHKVRAIARNQSESKSSSVPALLYEEVPEFRWELQPRFEVVDELCHAAKWFPSIRTNDLRRERREAVIRMLVRNKRPPALALMTEAEADVAAGAIVVELHRKWGKTALRKVFDEQQTFESLGIADEIDVVLSNALHKPLVARRTDSEPDKLRLVAIEPEATR